jgi:hypothetical protein
MSATSAARAYVRDVTSPLTLMRASDKPLSAAAERTYPPLRPTVYRPSRPAAKVPGREVIDANVLVVKRS